MKTVRGNSHAPCCYWVKSHKRKICMSTAQDGSWRLGVWSLATSWPGDLTVSRKAQNILRWNQTHEPFDRPAKGRCLRMRMQRGLPYLSFPPSPAKVKRRKHRLYSLEDDTPNIFTSFPNSDVSIPRSHISSPSSVGRRLDKVYWHINTGSCTCFLFALLQSSAGIVLHACYKQTLFSFRCHHI